MIEVEVKLPVDNRTETDIRLQELGFVPGDLVKESDIYFSSDARNMMETDEALRVRTSENLTRGRVSSYLTYKGPKIDQISMTRKELETKVASGKTCRDLLACLGFDKTFPVEKLRQYYAAAGPGSRKIHACLDQVTGLGSFLELEILVEKEEDRPGALAILGDMLKGLGSGLASTTRLSYLCMLMDKADAVKES